MKTPATLVNMSLLMAAHFCTTTVMSSRAEAAEKPLVFEVPLAPKLLDPLHIRSLLDWDIDLAIHDGLLVSSGQGLTPGLAEAWHIDSKTNVLNIKIRPNLRFSDGSAITAETVAESLERVGS